MYKILPIVLLTLASGCATIFTPPQEQPVLSNEYTSKSDSNEIKLIMSHSTATRRVIIADLYSGSICVEPPPESANSISASLATVLKADIPDKATLAAEISKSSSQRINQLYRRTQAVQLYRDAVFSLCQEKVNGFVDANNIEDEEERKAAKKQLQAEYKERLSSLLDKSINLLTTEIPLFYETEKLRFLTETVKPIIVCDGEIHEPVTPEPTDEGTENSNSSESTKSGTKIIKTGCKAVIPSGVSELINAYAKTMKKEPEVKTKK